MAFVRCNGRILLMDESALAELGLRNGQPVTEAQAAECITATARAFCRDMDARRAAGEGDIPDTSELAQMSGHTPVN